MEAVQKRSLFGMQRRERSVVEIEQGLDNLAFVLDDLFRIPGTHWRFGLDAVVGLVPVVGDTLAMFASLIILFAGVRYGVPKITLLRMALNVGIAYVIGLIPVIGDAFDFVWKPNKMNMKLIRKRATGKGKGTTGDYLFIFGLIGLLLLIVAGALVATALIIYYVVMDISTF